MSKTQVVLMVAAVVITVVAGMAAFNAYAGTSTKVPSHGHVDHDHH